MSPNFPCCFILPSHVLVEVTECGTPEQREAATRALTTSAAIRGRRQILTDMALSPGLGAAGVRQLAPQSAGHKTVYDAHHGGSAALPGTRVRGEDDPPARDVSVNEAFEGANLTHDFFRDVFNRKSIDDEGMELVSSVHFGNAYDNAFWNGLQMVYGDGSGTLFQVGSLTKDVAVIAHEISHGIVQFTSGLIYSKQSGALNESFADVFGSMVKQYGLDQDVTRADWLVGAGILGPVLGGVALRSMKDPGTAYPRDRQVGHMDDYQDLPDDGDPRNDNGGVHINSGIPNRAFHLVATKLGGRSWERAGRIWYETLTRPLNRDADFAAAADATIAAAASLFGRGGEEEQAVRAAWQEVGVL